MKKVIVLSLITVLCLPLAVYAASIGGAETQGKGKFSVGIEQEFVSDRDIKKKTIVDADGDPTEMNLEIDKMYRSMIKSSYGLLDNLDIYIKLGTADFESEIDMIWRDIVTGDYCLSKLRAKGDNAFAYGFGIKGKHEFESGWIIGGDFQYMGHKNDYEGTEPWTDYNAGGNVINSGTAQHEGKITFKAWHIAPYIAKKMGNFLPYLGVKYSDIETDVKGTFTDSGQSPEDFKVKSKADDNFGIFVGTDYKIGENIALNIEGRFVDETAVSLGMTFKF